MAYKRKTIDEFTLQCNYGYGQGWEDVTSEETRAEIKQRAKEYRENMPEYPYRTITKRIKLETNQ